MSPNVFPRLKLVLLLNFAAGVVLFFPLSPFFLLEIRSVLTGLDMAYFNLYVATFFALFQALLYLVFHRFPRRWALGAVFACETAWWFAIIVSFYVYSRFAVHIDHPIVVEMTRVQGGNRGVFVQWTELALAVSALASIALVQLAFFVGRFPRLEARAARLWTGRNGVRALVLVSIFTVFLIFVASEDQVGAVPSTALPGASRLARIFNRIPFGLLRPETFTFTTAPMASKPDVVLILAESFRAKDVSPGLTPNLHALMNNDRCVAGRRHYAGGHLTLHGSFSALFGWDAHLGRSMTQRRQSSPALANLRANGYSLKAFDASGLQSYFPALVPATDFDDYVQYVNRDETAAYDRKAVDDLLEDWKTRRSPAMRFLFLYGSHYDYRYPPEDRVAMPDELFKRGASQAEVLYNRYRNSLRAVDRQLGRVFDTLGKDAVVIFAGDHGEEFGEYGSEGHAAVRFEDVRTRVPMIFCWPGKTWPSPALSGNADFWPTFFDGAGVDPDWRRKTFSGVSMMKPGEARAYLPLAGGYSFTIGSGLALVVPDGKIVLETQGNFVKHLDFGFRLDLEDHRQSSNHGGDQKTIESFREDIRRQFF